MKKSAHGFTLARSAGFTLVELLVVIAIIAILAAVVVLIINPLELTRRSRDAARFTDLSNLQQAINVAVQEATGSATAILCMGGSAPCNGSSNTGTRGSDGTGWVKVDMSIQKSVSLPTLPIDPINDASHHYTYCSDGNAWEIDAVLEEKPKDEKKEEKKKTSGENTNPFLALLGKYESDSSSSPEKSKDEKKKDEKEAEIQPDSFIEKEHFRKKAMTDATKTLFTIFDLYKKAHGMFSYT